MAYMVSTAPVVLPVVLALVAMASVPRSTEAATAGGELGPAAGDCLSGPAASCHEEEVERAEAVLAEGMRTELLQRRQDLLRFGGGDGAAGADAERQRLRRTVEEQAEVIAELRQAVKAEDDTIEELLRERGNSSAEASPAADPGAAAPRPVAGRTAAAVDCGAYPMFCHPTVNCAADPLSEADVHALDGRIATQDGHANPRSWCMAYPTYATSLQKCVIEGDLRGYAQEMFTSQARANLLDADAVYCFVSGHCNDTEVQPNTTALESEAICDHRYGHERWARIGWRDFRGVLRRSDQAEEDVPATGWQQLLALARREAEISAATSCAMGNFHCDVMYCRANYCTDARYQARFGNLTWSLA